MELKKMIVNILLEKSINPQKSKRGLQLNL
jgi:hypothetical protein